MENFSNPSHSPIPNPSTQPSNAPQQTTCPSPSTAPPPNTPSPAPRPASQPSHPPPHPALNPSPVQPSRTAQPSVFHVPRNSRQTVLDFSRNSRTPESKAKHALLSDNPNSNAIALVGMGGTGKTTILRALGRHTDVWQRFPDGVWFIELGHDAKVQRLFDQLEQIVAEAFPDFLPKFVELTAKDNTHTNMMGKLVDLLGPKRFLLIFDDVWDLDATVYKLVDTACKGVQEMEGGSCKVLTSTRNEAISGVPTHDVSIAVSPGDLRRETCIEILCRYAGIDTNRLQFWSLPNRGALDNIVDLCAGLPLALSVAGSGMQELFGRCTDVCGPNAIVQYWESLKQSSVELCVAETGSRHVGLDAAIQTSLESLEREWKGKSMTVGEMFRSFCVVEKQMYVPLCVVERVWEVEDVLSRVRMFSRHSLVSLDEDEGRLVRGIRLHDLVHDVCVEMAEGREGVRTWHARLVDGYQVSVRTSQRVGEDGEGTESEGDEWWERKKGEKYMDDNVVRHLLGAWRVSAALKLLTDYRWIEKMNKDKERPPFQKVIAELGLVRRHLEEEEKTEIGRRIARDLDVVTRAMELCMVPYCMKNRKECTFQLFGRLRDVVSESGLVEQIVCSIERYAERPWARCGPGVLKSGRSSLRRVLELEGQGRCMCVRRGGEEIIVGGWRGEVWVLDSRDGRVKRTLVGDEDSEIVAVFFDHISGLMYSCNRRGQVTVWNGARKLLSMQAEIGDKQIYCMQVLSSSNKVVLGTTKGRLMVMDATSGKVVRNVAVHAAAVSSLAIGGSEDKMVSGLSAKTIRVWDTTRFVYSGTVFRGHTDWVTSVALSADGKLLASGSTDKSVRIWDVQSGDQLWSSPSKHYNRVNCVLFSADGRLLYSAGLRGTNVWRVMDGGRDVSLVHTLLDASEPFVRSFCLGDGPELFCLGGRRIHVWDAREVGSCDDSVDRFLPDVLRFGVSENGITMLTWNSVSRRMEIRNVCDVSGRIDRVISSSKIPDYEHDLPAVLAVSNNRQFAAYSLSHSCVVYIIDAHNGNVLHSTSDLEEWALSFASDKRDIPSDSSSSPVWSSIQRVKSIRDVGLPSFSADSNVISSFAAARRYPHDGNEKNVETKSVSWNVSSGKSIDETHLDGDSIAMSSTVTPSLVCSREFDGWSFCFARNVAFEHSRSSFTIATVEDNVRGAHYIADTSRLHFLTEQRGMFYVDLITDNTHLPPRNPSPLPLLREPCPSPSQNKIANTGPEEVYDVFLSHAGPDKLFIAEPLFDALVANGLKVFLDKRELHPGQNAPQKMDGAMETARIAVVILSPQFAGRPWTMKELLCFLRRFRSAGERGVIIIPVFYRLTLEDCRNALTITDEDGNKVLMTEEFLQRMAWNSEYGIADVVQGLQEMRGITGIENFENATNGGGSEAAEKRKTFIGRIVEAVMMAMGRIETGNLAGPSRVTS